MQICEVWSISAERIRDYLLSQSDVLQKENDRFSCGLCELSLTALPLRKTGRFRFPQTKVEFSGPEDETLEIHRRFVIQFISAGG
ncbi:MAG: hypothetical protein K6C12_15075 [Oscillospiraceae bacterium]|nr:hypothetical protein [Oscillospiraceae bacterium]